jgi:hypothetical protein
MITLQRGYVETVDYENPNGNLIGRSIPECLQVVRPCLPASWFEDEPRPPMPPPVPMEG